MGKGQRNRTRRADNHRRRPTRLDALALDGWHTVGSTDLDNADFDDVAFPGPPDDALLDTTDCPVADRCAGCGAVSGLRAITSAFSKPGGYDVGCATLCGVCDGRSFLHLLDAAELEQAFARHAAHPHTGPACAAEVDLPVLPPGPSGTTQADGIQRGHHLRVRLAADYIDDKPLT